ncbi:hypothetical protein JCM10207_007233 [Rhodosporidiobolus poonsookiae]
MASYTPDALKTLTVPKLKDILAQHSLPVTGRKDDLIARILAASLAPSDPATTDTTGPASATDEPDGQGHAGTAEVSQAANADDAASAQAVVQGSTEPSAAADGAQPAQGGDDATAAAEEDAAAALEKAQAAREAEEERRRKRLERFGGGVSAGEEKKLSDEEEAKKKRAEKFGIQVEEPKADTGKLDKSLALLDAPLGSQRRQRAPKSTEPGPTSKSNPATENGVVGAALKAAQNGKKGKVTPGEAAAEPAAAVKADPELQKRKAGCWFSTASSSADAFKMGRRRIAEEEEKKRKRAERFNAPSQPAEKKAKLDAPAESTSA